MGKKGRRGRRGRGRGMRMRRGHGEGRWGEDLQCALPSTAADGGTVAGSSKVAGAARGRRSCHRLQGPSSVISTSYPSASRSPLSPVRTLPVLVFLTLARSVFSLRLVVLVWRRAMLLSSSSSLPLIHPFFASRPSRSSFVSFSPRAHLPPSHAPFIPPLLLYLLQLIFSSHALSRSLLALRAPLSHSSRLIPRTLSHTSLPPMLLAMALFSHTLFSYTCDRLGPNDLEEEEEDREDVGEVRQQAERVEHSRAQREVRSERRWHRRKAETTADPTGATTAGLDQRSEHAERAQQSAHTDHVVGEVVSVLGLALSYSRPHCRRGHIRDRGHDHDVIDEVSGTVGR